MDLNREEDEVENPQPQASSSASSASNDCNYLPWEHLKVSFSCLKDVSTAKNFSVTCLQCSKKFSTARSSSSNLVKHLKAAHSDIHKSYLEEKAKGKETDVQPPKRQKFLGDTQPLISNYLVDKDRKAEFVSQKRVNEVVRDCIVNDALPFDIVESPHFRSRVLLGFPQNLTVMSRKHVVTCLEEDFNAMKRNLDKVLSDVQYVATTADGWSKFRRAYLGMTIHWIDENSLERKAAALTLRRIYGSHTYDVLAEEMDAVHKEYLIHNKVVRTSTDNGSNFVKAFRIFSDFPELYEEENAEESSAQDEEIVDLTNILDDRNGSDVILPPHQRCAAHTLSRVAVKDAAEALQDKTFKKNYEAVFSKLRKLWNKQNQSTLAADALKASCGVYFKVPNVTRWNSLHDAVEQVVKVQEKNSDSLAKAFDFVGLARLSPTEIAFIQEYQKVTSPIALALDILQGEKSMYLGYLLPTITMIKKKISALESSLKFCLPLANALLSGVDRRFQDSFKDADCILAACAIPKFQLDWLESEEEIAAAKGIILKALTLEAQKSFKPSVTPDPTSAIAQNDQNEGGENGTNFFDFKSKREAPVKPIDLAQEEMKRYLGSTEKTLNSLHDLPLMKKVFIKSNTALPSSASVERLFSIGGNCFAVRRGKLADKSLEMQVLLKANKLYTKM